MYSFLAAMILFTLGGLYALYEGYHKLILICWSRRWSR
jgi:hypothetical protein